MKALAIDTSTSTLSLAFLENEKVVHFRNYKMDKQMASGINDRISQFLKLCHISLGDIDVFITGLGPGTFTGLRIGVSSVKGLCMGVKKSVIGISSLDAVALSFCKEGSKVCVLNDAKRNKIYAAFYHLENGRLKRVSDYLLDGIDEILELSEDKTLFVGDAVKMVSQKISQHAKKHHLLLRLNLKSNCLPQAKNLGILAVDRIKNGDYDNINSLVPMYMHPEDCQVKK